MKPYTYRVECGYYEIDDIKQFSSLRKAVEHLGCESLVACYLDDTEVRVDSMKWFYRRSWTDETMMEEARRRFEASEKEWRDYRASTRTCAPTRTTFDCELSCVRQEHEFELIPIDEIDFAGLEASLEKPDLPTP